MRNPVTGSQLSARWLTSALAEQTGGARITSLDVDPMAGDDALFSAPARLHVTWAGDPALPSSFVAKAVASGDPASALGASLGVFRREAAFYNELADRCGVRAPKAWFAWAADDATLLILDDLVDQRAGDGRAGLSADDASVVLEALATMHARWWRDPSLASLPWLARGDDAATVATDERVRTLLPVFVDRCGGGLGAVELGLLAEVARSASSWRLPLLDGPHRTLVHGDVKPGNLFFSGSAPTFIDWQGVKVASPALDVASLLGCGLLDADTTVIAGLLADYEACLAAVGVGLDREAWRDELRLAAHAMLIPCIAGAEVAADDFVTTLAITARRRISLALSLREN